MKTIMFWSCTGIDAAELSYGTAKMLSEEEKTLIAELPCLGIPRLSFVCENADNARNTETAITKFGQGDELRWDMVRQISKRFFIVAADIYSLPDYPITARVDADTLREFIPALQKLAEEEDCGRLVLECQGQLISPMSFFAIKAADHVVIPLGKTTGAAYALASVRRLVQVYRQPADKFIIAAAGNPKAIGNAACSKNGDDDEIKAIRFTDWDSRKIIRVLEGRSISVRNTGFSNSGVKKEKAAERDVPVYL